MNMIDTPKYQILTTYLASVPDSCSSVLIFFSSSCTDLGSVFLIPYIHRTS